MYAVKMPYGWPENDHTHHGEVDHHHAKQLMRDMERKIELHCPSVLQLDLAGVTFMDSSGIAVLLRSFRRMQETEGRMEVIGVPHQAGRVLKTAGLHKMIPMKFDGRSE